MAMKKYSLKTLKDLLKIREPFLKQALIHRSFLNENKKITVSNERLEFLGDAVLELCVSEFLYKKYPEKNEGELTRLRSKIVCTKTLSFLSKSLNLGNLLFLSRGEESSGGRENNTLLANTFEAVIGALYLDQGKKTVEEFLEKNLFSQLEAVLLKSSPDDFKSQFQELVQAKELATPVYKLIEAVGPDHQKNFKVCVMVADKIISYGLGSSKRQAEQAAAKLALEKF